MGSRIMVFGAGGQVGTHLIEIASRSGHHMVALTRSDADICDADAVAAAIAEHAPTVIVNAAAYTAVDRAESEEDRMFYGTGLTPMLQRAMARASGCTVFAYLVTDPERYGVVEFDSGGHPVSIVEKPKEPKSNWAMTGLYFYDNRVLDTAANLKPSARGELEITDVNLAYLASGELNCERMGRGFAWLDTGTPDSILDAAEFVRTIEQRQGWMIACIEEIAYRSGFIDAKQLLKIASSLKNTYYGRYLETVAHEARHQY